METKPPCRRLPKEICYHVVWCSPHRPRLCNPWPCFPAPRQLERECKAHERQQLELLPEMWSSGIPCWIDNLSFCLLFEKFLSRFFLFNKKNQFYCCSVTVVLSFPHCSPLPVSLLLNRLQALHLPARLGNI